MSATYQLLCDAGADLSFKAVWRTSVAAGTWQSATDYGVGDTVVPRKSTGYVYTCSTAGLSEQYEPSWSDQLGDTVQDGSVVWTVAGPSVEPVDLTGYTAVMSIGIKGSAPVVTVSDVPSGAGSIVLGSDGSILVDVVGATTLTLTAPVYNYDLFVVNPNQATPFAVMLLSGTVTVRPNVSVPTY